MEGSFYTLVLLAIFQSWGIPADAGEYCYKNGKTEYCSGYCCSSEEDYCCTDWGWIAGVVVGSVVFLAVVGSIIFLVCHKMKNKKAQTVHVQTLNAARQPYQSNTHRSSRRPNPSYQNNEMYSLPSYGNGYNNTFLPPPPPYSQTYNQTTVYPAPPPYPGSPMPPTSGGNGVYSNTPQMTSHMHASGDIAYPPPPVS